MKSTLGLLLSIAFASVVSHADDLRLGTPSYGGTGCPGGSVGVAVAPDQKSISMLFDSYVVMAGGGQAFDRKVCNIAIPIHVPQGFSVSVVGIDYRGFTGLPSGGRAQLAVNYFLANNPNGFRTTKTFYGPMTAEYLKSDSLGVVAQVWTACGADTILRANTSMLVQTNSRSDQAMATVDSADISAGLIYHLQWRRCN
jgi:Domain of unknown function (DUF4360)